MAPQRLRQPDSVPLLLVGLGFPGARREEEQPPGVALEALPGERPKKPIPPPLVRVVRCITIPYHACPSMPVRVQKN